MLFCSLGVLLRGLFTCLYPGAYCLIIHLCLSLATLKYLKHWCVSICVVVIPSPSNIIWPESPRPSFVRWRPGKMWRQSDTLVKKSELGEIKTDSSANSNGCSRSWTWLIGADTLQDNKITEDRSDIEAFARNREDVEWKGRVKPGATEQHCGAARQQGRQRQQFTE